MRVSNVARSAASISAAAATPSEFIADAETVILWHFNEDTGQTVADDSGNAYDLSLGNDATAETIDPVWNTTGLFGAALDFNSAETDYCYRLGASVGTFSDNKFTVEFWVKKTDTGTYAQPFKGTDISVVIEIGSNGLVTAGVGDSIDWTLLNSTTVIDDGEWHYVALVFDGP